MGDELILATFEAVVGSAFEVGSAGTGLVLDSVVAHASTPGAPREQPFSLLFLGPAGQHLPQGTYRVEHARIGTHDLFIVPLGPAPDGSQQYEAAFN